MKRTVSKIFVLSRVGEEELVREGFETQKIIISGAGVNAHRTINRKKKDQIIYVGRVNITKGAFDLIDIFAKVARSERSLDLVIVGGSSPQDEVELNNRISRYGLANRASYLGFVSEEKKRALISESKLLVLPSKEEGFGIVIMEALQLRTPVVCFDLPALKSIFFNSGAVYLVHSFNQDEFADTIRKVLRKRKFKFGKISTWEDVYKIQSKYF